MKVKTILRMMAAATLCIVATACSNEDDGPKWNTDGSKVELPKSCMFVLNQGTWHQNNANLSFIDPDKVADDIPDIFYVQNGYHLGDTGHSIIWYRGDMYISVHTSNLLVRLNAAGVEQARATFATTPGLQGGIRYIAGHGNSIYASFYGGTLVRLNAATLQIEETVKEENMLSNFEGLAIANDKIYVSNAYSVMINGATGANEYVYHDEVLVYSTKDMSLLGKIGVGTNPNKIIAAGDKLVVLCLGNYFDEGYRAFLVDLHSNTSTEIGSATEAAVYGDKVFLAFSDTDWMTYTTTNTYYTYDLKTGKVDNSPLFKNAPEAVGNTNVSMISVDPRNGDIYVGITHYASSDGDLYRFDRQGNYIGVYNSGGQHPVGAIYY